MSENFFDLNVDPGEGNLNARAYVASLVGPRRVFQGQRKKQQLQTRMATEVARNASPHREAFFVAVWLPITARAVLPLGVGITLLFSTSESMGDTSDTTTLFLGVGEPNHYHAVLLPNEQLFASVFERTDGTAIPAGTTFPVMVSQVAF